MAGLLGLSVAFADDGVGDQLTVGKSMDYVQTSATAVALRPASDYPYHFDVYITAAKTGATAPTVKLPSGTKFTGPYGLYLSGDQDDEEWVFGVNENADNWSVRTKAELDGLFPNGTYTFKVNNKTVSLKLTGDSAYPDIPKVTLTGGEWKSGRYVIASDKALTITTTYAGFGAHLDDFIGLELVEDSEDNEDEIVDAGYLASAKPGKKTLTYTVPAKTLKAGKNYHGNVYYTAIVSKSTVLAGYFSAGLYEKVTDFEVSVIAPTVAPKITTQPKSQTIVAGAGVTFSVVATGSPAPGFQWQKDGKNISGATASTYKIAKTSTSSAGSYGVVVKNSGGSVTSSAAKLTINVKPAISTQPKAQTVELGAKAVLSVKATGTPSVTYQWYQNDKAISGAQSSTYTITRTVAGSAGTYKVVVKNSAGSVTSASVALAVNVAPAALTAGLTVKLSGKGTYQEGESSGAYTDAGSLKILSSTKYQGGTYTYKRTGATTATLTYRYQEPGYTETGTAKLKFTSASAGTFSSTGSYVESGVAGTFRSSGSFTYKK